MTDEIRAQLEKDIHENGMKASVPMEAQGQIRAGIGGYECRRPSFSEEVANARFRAQEATKEASRLIELESLLEKNPDTRRILQLLGMVV